MENLSKQIENILPTAKASDLLQIKAYSEALAEYQKLVDKGLVAKRGFNILTTEEIYIKGPRYAHNQQSSQY